MASPRRRKHVVNVLFITRHGSRRRPLTTTQIILHTAPIANIMSATTEPTTSHAAILLLAISTASHAPELSHASQLVLQHLVVLIDESAHVGFEARRCID